MAAPSPSAILWAPAARASSPPRFINFCAPAAAMPCAPCASALARGLLSSSNGYKRPKKGPAMPYTTGAGNPFAVLTAIVAPAILTNASSVLALGTSNRLARVVDRTRIVAAQLAAFAPDTADYQVWAG